MRALSTREHFVSLTLSTFEHMSNQFMALRKLGITELNEMQVATHNAISSSAELVLLSPTGTGKTLAFLLPILSNLQPLPEKTQVLIIVPSRELAIQIEQVIRSIGSGFKTNAVYGGRAVSKDKIELRHAPTILIGTPGRIADHLRRNTIDPDKIHTLVLDEYDKSLEIGFADQIEEIYHLLPSITSKILTSATQKSEIPAFLELRNPTVLNFLDEASNGLKTRIIAIDHRGRTGTLIALLRSLEGQRGIIFCNLKDTIAELSSTLQREKIGHIQFYGGMEQMERERALIKFRNSTERTLLATDLAARGIDVPALDYIIHFELPQREDEFTHRNGRTARMQTNGTAYILKSTDARFPDFIEKTDPVQIPTNAPLPLKKWKTLFVSGGRKDKISKGDLAGFFFQQGGLKKGELGLIELKNDCSFVAVTANQVTSLIAQLNNRKLKNRKVRIYEI